MWALHLRWVVCVFVILLHWLALVFLYLESAPQNAHIIFGQLTHHSFIYLYHKIFIFFSWCAEDRAGFRRSVGLFVYGLPTVDADDCNMEICFNRTLCGPHPDNFTVSLYPPGDSMPIGGFYGSLVKPSKWWIRIRTALVRAAAAAVLCCVCVSLHHTRTDEGNLLLWLCPHDGNAEVQQVLH